MKIKSVEQAIELFELHSLKQYSTFDTGDYKTGNKSHDIAMDCINYLNEHHALESLRPFLKHEHPYVREFAAAVLLSVFQEECEDVLTELVKGNYRFASLSAEWVLREWNEGKYVSPFPTEQSTEKTTTSTKTNKSSNKRKSIQSVEEALLLFKECVEKRGTAIMNGDSKAANKLYPILNKALVYLYEHDSLAALHTFLSHEDFNVRQVAAYALLPFYEKESKDVLWEIANGDYRIYGIQGLNAKRTLMLWERREIYFPYKQIRRGRAIKKEEEVFPQETNNAEETTISKDFSPEILRLSQIFKCPPTDNYDLRNEESGFYVEINPERQELIININTFVNPYTQDMESVYKMRVERFKIFENVATISAENPSKYGFMKILITIPEKEAADDLLTQIKDAIDWNFSEWKPNECKVCCKSEYKGAECYFEGSWWYVWRAVIKNRKGYERYDFSDELKFDEEMWDLESGEYDDFENSDSFSLISPAEFESIWDKTTRIHKPVAY